MFLDFRLIPRTVYLYNFVQQDRSLNLSGRRRPGRFFLQGNVMKFDPVLPPLTVPTPLCFSDNPSLRP